MPPGLTCFELLDTIARLKGIRSRSTVLSMLESVGLHDLAKRPVESLSGGMRQRLGIAQALVGSPELVIVDEPTAGLDPEERVRFRNLLSEHKGLKLVLLSTHIVSDVESVATEIAVVRQGRLLAFGTPEELVARAAGAVWEAELSAAEMERLRPGLTVADLTRNAGGVKARLVAARAPGGIGRCRGRLARGRLPPPDARGGRSAPGGGVSLSRLLAVASADLRARLRRPATLVFLGLLLAAASTTFPDPSSGKGILSIGGRRAVYTSAALAVATAGLLPFLLGLFGFYAVSNAIALDRRSGAGRFSAPPRSRTASTSSASSSETSRSCPS